MKLIERGGREGREKWRRGGRKGKEKGGKGKERLLLICHIR